MTRHTRIQLAGEPLTLDGAGGAFLAARRLLVVADLHFEKGTAAAGQGSLVPPWDTRATLDRLAVLLRRFAPARVIALGDSFHDDDGAHRMQAADAETLRSMATRFEFIWVSGNHDPAHNGLPGQTVRHWREGALLFRHEARPDDDAVVGGHFHPKASVPVRGTHVTRPCFVTDGRRLIMPALGAYTGGLDIGDPAIASQFPRGGRAFLLGQDRVFSFDFGATRRRQAL